MKKSKNIKFNQRIIAAFLAVLMVLSLLPGPSITVVAETEPGLEEETGTEEDTGLEEGTETEGVKIAVVDENGTFISGATVEYSIYYFEDGEDKSQETFLAEKVNGTTSSDGTIKIISSADYEDYESYTLFVDAKISHGGYCDEYIYNEPVSSEDNIKVKLNPIIYPNIIIEKNSGEYDGEDRDAVNVKGYADKDVVYYRQSKKEEWTNKVPQISNAATYLIYVKVERDGHCYFESEEIKVEISPSVIEGIEVTLEDDITYNGESQRLVKEISGIEEDDKIYYSLKTKDDNTEKSWELATKTKIDGDKYSIKGPEAEEAGKYYIDIKVIRKNYKDKEIDLDPNEVTIKQAKQSIQFNNKGELPTNLNTSHIGEIYDFSISTEPIVDSKVSYTIERDYENDDRYEEGKENDEKDITEIATIDTEGKVTIKSAGYSIKIIGKTEGNNNYEDAIIEHKLTIKSTDETPIKFINKNIKYVFGTNGDIISNQEVSKKEPHDYNRITYSAKIEGLDSSFKDIGINFNTRNGELSIENRASLSQAISDVKDNNETLTITVTAEKGGNKHYGPGVDSYSITITTEPLPKEGAFTIQTPKGDVIDGPNGNGDWYNTAVTVIPTEGYLITKDPKLKSFLKEVEFNDQGTSDRIVYLRNTDTGGITAAILTDIENLDSKAPDVNNITIEYSESKNSLERFIEDILYDFKFYNPDVTITFTAYDDTSGVDTFNWQYTRSEGASEINTADDEGIIDAVQDKFEDKKYTATLTLPRNEAEQLRGRLSVSATDKAGNKSKIKSDERNIIVVDSISPTQTVSYELKDDENYNEVETTDGITHYFSGDVEFTFAINEANFYEDQVDFIVKKDGDDYYTPELQNLTWDKLSEDQSEEDQHEDLYVANLVLSEEGTYEISMHCTDYSGNEMEPYNSETIVIDKTAPKIEFSYANHRDNENPQSATITIEEKNFNKEDIELITVAKDIAGNEVKVNDLEEYLRTCEWTENGDRHTATISSQFVDAIYDLTINYKDLACNEADEVKPPTFIIDHVAPATSNMSVTYSTPLMKKILSKITFGYYNPSVNVTFTAHDDISGVDYFDWTYNRENGVSTSNKATYAEEKLIAVQDSKDKTKFTASITLPKNKAEQLRGNVTFKATDKSNNVSEKITDTNNVIVVDTIAPTMTVEYSDPSNTVGRKMYYNKAMTATFAVTEANFYSEDVIVELSKDGVSPIRIKPSWVDVSTDLHIGTYTIPAPSDHSKDGDYVISVKYKDRSNNQMKTYTSNTLVIDTTNPVISVLYADNSPINTMVDSEGNQRKYFSNTQTATVSIKERNFNANDMKYSIVAKDVEGNILNNNSLYRMSSWESKGDVHTMTITYPGDANYTFDLAYTDLATNEAADYRPDYFTVDTTNPTNHTVSYSTSLLDTILSNITFGFYDAKVRVTLSATDNTSKVNSFKYSYVNAAGVSSSNSELIDQIIEESGIRYSNGGATATTTFDIPKGLLGSNNQFNGTVNFDATDRSGNISDQSQETKRIVVDNISPTANVEYNTPVQTIGGVSYYDGDITPRVTINEANFYPEDVIISVTRDGQAYPVSPSWTDNSADVHVGSFTLSGDGDYLISVSYTDKSNNFMEEYTSEQLTIDTEINEPVLTINGEEADGKAFKDDILLEFSFEDINFESYEITLLRTNYGNKNVNVTDEFISDHIKVNETGVSAIVDTFEKVTENDGIYNIKVSFTDKAGHYAEKSAKFTVNRYGSVYEYNDYLISLIADGGAYTQKVDEDLVITEYNADRLLSQSLNIEVLRDGKPIDNPAIEVSPEIDNQVSAGNSGWYQYQYTINKSNFSGDGVYKIIVSSEDATGNNPENTNYDDKSIVFHVDSTPPEINSITGLDNNIINQANVDVNYTVYDAIGLASVEVYVDGKEINKITDFSSDLNNYSGSFTLSESSSEQKVRLLVTDLAGNVTDTSKEDFTSAYVFNDSVIVSTNAFVRWTANKPVFWGSIATAAGALMIGTTATVYFRRKKRIKE